MVSARPRILSISFDATVFDSRNRVLEFGGFEVVPCFCGIGATERFATEQIDAVLIGESLPRALRLSLIQEFRAAKPSVPIIVSYRIGEFGDDICSADAAVESLDGPERLIQTVSSLLHKPLRPESRPDKNLKQRAG